MIYSYEQGVKIEVFELFKVLLDNEQTERKVEYNDLFYKEVLPTFNQFLKTVEDLPTSETQEEGIKLETQQVP